MISGMQVNFGSLLVSSVLFLLFLQQPLLGAETATKLFPSQKVSAEVLGLG